VSDNLKSIQLTEIKLKCDRCEDVWIELKINNNKNLIVGSMYRHPSNVFKQFENEFINIIKTFKTNQKYIVLGDFNINYRSLNAQQNIRNYDDHINSFGCSQLIDKPTKITQSSNTIIDHIYTSSALMNQVLPIVIYKDISDHLPTSALVRCKTNKKNQQKGPTLAK